MRRGVAVLWVALWYWVTPLSTVYAEEPFFGSDRAAAVLNAPGIAVDISKAAANITQPGVEYLYDLGGEGRIGTSVALWTFKQADVPLVALRAGYATDYLPYASAPIDLKGVTQRYVVPHLPGKVNAWLTAGPLDMAWAAIGKYGVVGPWIGINFDEEEDGNDGDGGIVGGVSVGAKLTF